jgi:hypothetical protein
MMNSAQSANATSRIVVVIRMLTVFIREFEFVLRAPGEAGAIQPVKVRPR